MFPSSITNSVTRLGLKITERVGAGAVTNLPHASCNLSIAAVVAMTSMGVSTHGIIYSSVSEFATGHDFI